MGARGTKKQAGRFGPRVTAAAGLTVLVTAFVLPPPDAEAVFVAGACVLDVTLDAVGEVDVELGQPTWEVSGSGDCTVTGHVDPLTGHLDGSLTGAHATSAGCAAGVYLGSLTFSVEGGLPAVDSTVVVSVMAGPVLQLDVVTAPTFAGAGIFAQTTTDELAACPLGTNDVTTWTGAFAFEDPTV